MTTDTKFIASWTELPTSAHRVFSTYKPPAWRTRRALRLALVIGLSATACGGETAAGPPETTTSTSATTTSTTVTATIASPDPERLCEIDSEFGLMETAAEARGGPPSPDELREEIALARRLLDEAIRVAPDEIRASIETVANGRARWFELQESNGFDVESIDEDPRTPGVIEENFISGETARANEAWEQWNADNC